MSHFYKQQRYRFLTTEEAQVQGWLKKQLRTVADGLPGNLDLMWRDVRDSKWIGGDADGWERFPYWLDGFIPLAFLLKDENMIARAKRYVNTILDNQCDDGWICPCTKEERPTYDIWALLLLSKALVGYADSCPEDSKRVENALLRAFRQAEGHLRSYPLFDWGRHRWFEGLIAIRWLYIHTKEEWLLDFAQLLHSQGRDYVSLFENEFDAYRQPDEQGHMDSHVVNLSMALKADTMWKLFSCDNPEAATDSFSEKMYQMLMQYHGMPVGQFSGDECLSGRSPIQGTELCGIVEAMHSHEWLLAITGNPVWGARLERLAFNALPATTSPDMWRHQYDQQVNQMLCAPYPVSPFRTNSAEAGVFGLEPHFGCCTANLPQGWPKLALAAFMVNDDAIFSAIPLPITAHLKMHGENVTVECNTNYPFEDSVIYRVTTEKPIEFSLDIRIPDKAVKATVDGAEVKAGTVVSLSRTWEGSTVITADYSFEITMEDAGYGELQCVNRGSLLFSLPVDAYRVPMEFTRNGIERKKPYHDEYLFPKGQWAFGFTDAPLEPIRTANEENSLPVFAPENVPLKIRTTLCPIAWGNEPGMTGYCAKTPLSTERTGELQTLELIPYGFTDLRMTALPKL